MRNKEALKRFREKCNLIFESTSVEAFESEEVKQKRIDKARKDLPFLLNTIFRITHRQNVPIFT